ncbi:DUF445 domain-containing protein [Celerinatantimonas sp. YJH-8]|uniref:DUF445 domain-containing protein n=1 Tax=Celerinatantimonas sp. YJH-8 TaxID=3228714 RepID=UPI0038C71364
MSKYQALRRAKAGALACLIVAAIVFTITVIGMRQGYHSLWLSLIKTASEAAMVGGIADWFAISALFRPIPSWNRRTVAGLHIPHTDVVVRNQPMIAENLALFVKERFFHETTLVRFVREVKPTQVLTQWLSQPQNAAQLSHYISQFLAASLRVYDDRLVQAFIWRGVRKIIRYLDLSSLAAQVLDVSTKDGRHQVVLSQLLGQLSHYLNNSQTQQMLAQRVSSWLKSEHYMVEKLLPTEWLSEKSAQLAIEAMANFLSEIQHADNNPVREQLEQNLATWIEKLRRDPIWRQKIEKMTEQILVHQHFAHYLYQIWQDLCQRLAVDLDSDTSITRDNIAVFMTASAKLMSENQSLQVLLDTHLESAAQKMAPKVSNFVVRHIQKTVESWDAREIVNQIELNIGKDLQKVRVNGTLVGALIGMGIFLVEHLLLNLPF